MSRLIVKNLPSKISESKLKEQFAAMGVVTDCQLKYTKEGVFRKFAFLGFQEEKAAQAAVEYFDQTFIGTARIRVEICRPFGDETKPRAWSKYAKDSSAFKKAHQNADVAKSQDAGDEAETIQDSAGIETPRDSAHAEFMSLQVDAPLILKPNPETENSMQATPATHTRASGKKKMKKQSKKVADNMAVDEASAAPDWAAVRQTFGDFITPADSNCTVLIAGLPDTSKPKSLKQFAAPVRPKKLRISRLTTNEKVVNGGTSVAAILCNRPGDAKQLLKRDGEFFGGYKLTMAPYSEGAEALKVSKTPALSEKEIKAQAEEAERANIELITDTGRIFLRNLSYLCTEENLQALLRPYGSVTDIVMPIDFVTKRPKGFAMATFIFPEDAVKAYTELDGSIFHGRMLHVLPGKETEKDKEITAETSQGSSYKTKKSAEMKKAAASSHNWNTLFLAASVVADVISDKLSKSKSDVLSAETKKSLGVRLALGESQIVQETRKFLLEHGVALDCFSQPDAPRNKRVILVKNLPANTDTQLIREIFEKHGVVGRVVLPPAGICAIVEFVHSQEAKTAFKSLAYKRFQHIPLFLEWAPGDVFSDVHQEKTDAAVEETDKDDVAAVSDNNAADNTEDLSEEEGSELQSTLFVKNLNFSTTDETLRSLFEKVGPLVYASVALKKDIKRSTGFLSMGYGFVQYKRSADAAKALKDLQHRELEGHRIELKLSDRRQSTQGLPGRKKQRATKQKSSKILVRNIPFQASQKEVTELFKHFGTLKTVRMPKKLAATAGSHHRGFAFVDFVSNSDAKRAFETMCHSTHLYGRRLVLEWAADEETVEDVRKRTAEHYFEGESKAKKAKGMVGRALLDDSELAE